MTKSAKKSDVQEQLVDGLLVAWETIPKWSEGDLACEVMEQIEAALASVGLDTQDKLIKALRAQERRTKS